jgi:predicted DNA-binding transcriptional regulator AlpA
MSEAIDYDKLADAVANKLRLLPPFESVLWNAEQCADYLNISESNFSNRISKSTKFPSPSILPSSTGGNGGKKLWFAHEVTKWSATRKKTSSQD